MKTYNVIVESIHTDFVEVNAASIEEAKDIAKRTVSDIYESVDYSSDKMKFLYGDSKFKAYVEEQ